VGYIVSNFVEEHLPTRERAWIARQGGRRLGCIFCMRGKEDHAAQLRLFLVLPEARRRGLGRRLLTACRDFAAEAGYRELILYTHAEHEAACALYRAFGFTLTERYPVTAYGRDLEEQIWAIPLDPPLAKQAPRI
jgi:ribosomal protein S18 acetylase RimI-like enzyme